MAHLVACPVCGCKMLVPEAGSSVVRCIGCGHRFTATAEESPPPRREETPPRAKKEKKPHWYPPGVVPRCPACERQVAWHDPICPHCGEAFEDESERPDRRSFGKPGRPRRDTLPHRGAVLGLLANVALGFAGLGFCTAGLTALVAVPLAVVVLLVANGDLARMGRGEIDPAGRGATEAAQGLAGAALLLGFLVGALFLGIGYWWWL